MTSGLQEEVMIMYPQFEPYDVKCSLSNAKTYCTKYNDSPCCFFCKDKDTCNDACKNDPTKCNHAICHDKK